MQDIGQRLHELGLAHAGDALQQHVAPGQQACHHAIDDLVVADDDAPHFLAHEPDVVPELLDAPLDVRNAHCALSPLSVKNPFTCARCRSAIRSALSASSPTRR